MVNTPQKTRRLTNSALGANSWPYRFILGILFGSRLMAHGSRLMAHDSWLMAHDSWLMAHGSWLMANKKFAARARGLGDPAANFLLAMSHEP